MMTVEKETVASNIDEYKNSGNLLSKDSSQNEFFSRCANKVLNVAGWYCEPIPHKYKKAVIAYAPHTSNWDFPLLIGARFANKVNVQWAAKSEMFRWPFKNALKFLGGVPIERAKSTNMVQTIVNIFNDQERFLYAMSPEGTRKYQDFWRSGFYYIALEANVPIILYRLDYKNKRVTIGDVIQVTGDIEKDLAAIDMVFKDVEPKFKEKYCLAKFKNSVK
ncbi:MAG: lysophospholipid acyltransferase family protein [Moritella sp.]|uniref:lysophospholipid acyltransferase family protein n=1 Tax=Moritella sp. TaxID=78556 RepID=UPI0029B561C8|nr:lysophospholipid acyltransferase family protein [Moritella sp.]MDX2319764.1 lysophospholipid acyltransferase family protein [Moritella sp.]